MRYIAVVTQPLCMLKKKKWIKRSCVLSSECSSCALIVSMAGEGSWSQKREVSFSRMKGRATVFYIFVYSVLQNRHLQKGNKKLETLLQVVPVVMQHE